MHEKNNHRKKKLYLFLQFISLEIALSFGYRLICFAFNWGVYMPFNIKQVQFWQYYLLAHELETRLNFFIAMVWSPFADNFFIVAIYILVFRIGRKYFSDSTQRIRLFLFCLIVLFLFPYAHTPDILSYRFTSLIILAAFMLYAFIYVSRLPQGSTFLAYLASVLVHLVHNNFCVLVEIIAYYLIGGGHS